MEQDALKTSLTGAGTLRGLSDVARVQWRRVGERGMRRRLPALIIARLSFS